jgi:hypothetical protein
MKQILSNISEDMYLLSEKLELDEDFDIDEHIQMLQNNYKTIEEKLVSGGSTDADEENIENGGMVFL